MDPKVEKIMQYINQANNVVFFGGAGVSTESGIPDFRSKEGLYNQHDVHFDGYRPEYLLSRDCLYEESKVFYEFYRQKMDTRSIRPNITHKVLARLEQVGKVKAIVTQNIDGLHQKAGSKNVYEIHGTTERNHCVKCGKDFDGDSIFNSRESIPRCPRCQGMIRPDVVLYGESLPEEAVSKSVDAIRHADVLIIGGTSLTVYPASQFIYDFQGEHLVVINKEKLNIKLKESSDVMICGSLGDVFFKMDPYIG